MAKAIKNRDRKEILLAERDARERIKRGLPLRVPKPAEPGAAADPLPPDELPEEVARLVKDADPGERPDMIVRLYRAFEAQVDGVEAWLNALLAEAAEGASIVEIDRTVKTLASLARTLSLLLDLKKTVGPESAAEGKPGETGNDDLEDADELRAQLAQRLGRLCPGAEAGTGAGAAVP
ncbi:hypothetical protein [uncultured Roseibium sp.]|uniref:hypothetical protein n=1 Tax=uncultured Roseibium sp. TaxID=1936171 RepID=UPI0025992427|nr:hypothetical protein [uncultured Roseibium sp.]